MPENAGVWDKTKQYSNTAYTKALKPGFDKAYNLMNKLEPHVNKLTYKVGSESFWPGTLDKESEKAARILRSFCKDGFYDQIDEAAAKKAEAEGIDLEASKDAQGKTRAIMKIPAKVIRNAKGLAIFTCMRTGWVIGGSGGAGILIGRHPETGEWSPPSGIHMQNLSFGFLIGVDFTDTVLVINSYEALEAFTKVRCTLGTEVGVAAGPLGIGGTLDTQVHKKPAPVWSYVKSRGLYGGVAVDGNVVIERTDENESFYNERVGVAKILLGEVRYPPVEKYKVLMDTVKAAQGDDIDESLLPDGVAPGDMEIASPGPVFGIPDEDDPDPFGVKALEAQGLSIREAGTHRRASPETFEFRPSPTSPAYRRSIDAYARKKEWRGSVASVTSMSSIDRGTQTDEDEAKSPRVTDSPFKESEVHYHSPLRGSISAASATAGHDTSRATNTDANISRLSAHTNGTGLGIDTGAVEADISAAETPIAVTADEKLARKIGFGTSKEKKPNGVAHDHHDADDDADSDEDGNYSDFEEVEIVTAVPATAKPKAGMVNIPHRIPPALPPRNPGRVDLSPSIEEPPNSLDTALTTSQSSEHGQENTTSAVDRRSSGSRAETQLKPESHGVDDEFHSAAPSPMEEKKQIEAITAS